MPSYWRETKKVNYWNKNVEIIGRKHTTYGIGKTKHTRFRNTRQTFPIFLFVLFLLLFSKQEQPSMYSHVMLLKGMIGTIQYKKRKYTIKYS